MIGETSFTNILNYCGDTLFGPDIKTDSLRFIYENNFLPEIRKYAKTGTSCHMVIQGMIDYKLSEEEAFLILAYSSHIGKYINAGIKYDKESSKCMTAIAKALNAALGKMPSYGSDVFRMNLYIGDESTELSWFKSKIGKVFNTPFFLSTSRENWGSCKVVWKIETLKDESLGRDISTLCQVPSEKEVLFMQNAKFLIREVDIRKGIVYLTEKQHKQSYDFPLVGDYTLNY